MRLRLYHRLRRRRLLHGRARALHLRLASREQAVRHPARHGGDGGAFALVARARLARIVRLRLLHPRLRRKARRRAASLAAARDDGDSDRRLRLRLGLSSRPDRSQRLRRLGAFVVHRHADTGFIDNPDDGARHGRRGRAGDARKRPHRRVARLLARGAPRLRRAALV